jgi:prophage antirepressor-like protein
MNNMTITEFNYKNNIVNTITDSDDETWFRGKDVAIVLGYSDTTQSIRYHVHSDDKKILSSFRGVKMKGLSHNEKNTIYINESGLHSLILGSKLKSAKRFKRWITKEVLPSIRKTGSYSLPNTQTDNLLEMKKIELEHKRFMIQSNIDELNCMKDIYLQIQDVRLQSAVKDNIFNRLTNQNVETKYSRDISEIAYRDYGIVLNQTQKIKIGQMLKKEYLRRYKKNPPKTEKEVNGSIRKVNAYLKHDEPWIIHTIQNYIQ